MKLTAEELQRISDAVGEREGWDFSRVRTERARVSWHVPAVARRFLTPTDPVLDVGSEGLEAS